MFLFNSRLVWRKEPVPHEPWNYGARDARAVCVFAVSENLKASFSLDSMPAHARLDVFIENATKMI